MPKRRPKREVAPPLPDAIEAEPQVKIRYRGVGKVRIAHGTYSGEFSAGQVYQVPLRVWMQFLKGSPELEKV